ncbi:MAG TPA: hypothetical protein DD433_05910 [Ruminococcaceae bacterium]|nr:hypothetical protein [Oscillospiraceae bacterium]
MERRPDNFRPPFSLSSTPKKRRPPPAFLAENKPGFSGQSSPKISSALSVRDQRHILGTSVFTPHFSRALLSNYTAIPPEVQSFL